MGQGGEPVDFARTIVSHGVAELPPNRVELEARTLETTLPVARGARTVRIMANEDKLRIEAVAGSFDPRLTQTVAHMFRLDDDMREFYRSISGEDEFAWIANEGAGRLLRSPTVFEDLVKMICTTNCSWALTEKMVAALVNELGKVSDDERKSFPTAAAMDRRPVGFFRDKIRSGYRAPYLKELAQRVARGSLDVESWLTSDLPVAELLKEMKSVKGVGNYAAENLLKLLGRYDGLALDSWTRAQFARVRNQDRAANDKKISRFYARFGSWRGLVLWCDMTRHWLDPDNIGNW